MDLFESTLHPITEDLRDPEAELPPLRTSSGRRWWTGGWPSGCCGRETCWPRSFEDFYFSKKGFETEMAKKDSSLLWQRTTRCFSTISPLCQICKILQILVKNLLLIEFWSNLFLNIPKDDTIFFFSSLINVVMKAYFKVSIVPSLQGLLYP